MFQIQLNRKRQKGYKNRLVLINYLILIFVLLSSIYLLTILHVFDLVYYSIDSYITEEIILDGVPISLGVIILFLIYLNVLFKKVVLTNKFIILMSDFSLIKKKISLSEIICVKIKKSLVKIELMDDYFGLSVRDERKLIEYFESNDIRITLS